MIKRNPYLQHTYESFDQPVPPRRHSQEESLTERVFGPDLAARFRSPLFATAALLLAGAAFAGIIIASYPDSASDENIPVITADASPLREAPSEPGGMDVANEDSTIFNSIRSAELQETAPIENLLAEEQPVDTQTALAPAEAVAAVEPAAGELQAPPPSEMADATATQEVKEAGEPKTSDVQVAERSIPMKSDNAAAENTDKPTIAPAATTPETLDYVRSVLEKKDAEAGTKTASADPAAERVAATEPASGVATSAGTTIFPGSSFVQLASISAESAAPKEWTKLQKTFPSLSGLEYRVQRADLGAKGVFFRIQAGPMSKDSAKSVCDSVKAQKPGGCIIVQ
ncbi:MAG: SPOR domain-containing protein [Alphaproteobacteria bacterium]